MWISSGVLTAVLALLVPVRAGEAPPPVAFDGIPGVRAIAFNSQGALFAGGPGVAQLLGPKLVQTLTNEVALPRGLAFSADGTLYAADESGARVLGFSPSGEIVAAFSDCGGRRLQSPCGVSAAAGSVYFVDRGAPLVCRDGRPLASPVKAPTAIAVSVDGSTVYVGDERGEIWKIGWKPRRVATGRGAVLGLALDERGNVYAAREGDPAISVTSPTGEAIGELAVPASPSNVAFGLADPKSLFVPVAAKGSIYRLTAPFAGQHALRALEITEPFDGAVLNRHDGEMTPGGLRVAVRGRCTGPVRVNGVPARVNASEFRATVTLRSTETRIVAESARRRDAITVLWDRYSFPRYRVSTDDNIRWLKDIAQRIPPCQSIFENSYLAFWREMHANYGTKVHFNVYYETAGFSLSQMPDSYRREWQANANWIRLTFHARADKPDRPYLHSTAERIRTDYRLVTAEIERFAGKELLSDVTTVHWGEATPEAVGALRQEGVKVLVGYFELRRELPAVSYDVTVPQLLYLSDHDYWKDLRRDLLFVRHDMVINGVELDQVAPRVEKLAVGPHQSGVLELMIHEQHF